MRAMILAAGLGKRARPLSDEIPKPLFPLAELPLIAYPLGLLKAAGITEIVVNVHHHADQIERVLGQYRDAGLDIAISREEHLLETGGGIANARRYLGDGTFVVINGDVICDIDLTAVIDDHRHSGAIATMVIRENPDPTFYSVVEWDTCSQGIVDIRGELGRKTPFSRAVMFTGIHVIEPTVFDYLLPTRESIIDGFYLPALREYRHVHGHFHDGYWADLGTIEQYQRTREEMKARALSHLQPLTPTAARA